MMTDYPIVDRAVADYVATAKGVTDFEITEHRGHFSGTFTLNGKRCSWQVNRLGPIQPDSEAEAATVLRILKSTVELHTIDLETIEDAVAPPRSLLWTLGASLN